MLKLISMEQKPFLERHINTGHIIAILATLFTASISFYNSTQIKLKELELRITLQEGKVAVIEKKLDQIVESQNQIKVILENKENRK